MILQFPVLLVSHQMNRRRLVRPMKVIKDLQLRDELLNGEIFYTLQEGQGDYRELETALQHRSSTLFDRLPTTRT
jgi:hypothetical protein